MRKNILLSFLFATVALLWTSSSQAHIYVAGVRYDKTQDITGPNISGKVHYNAETKTLTLEDAYITRDRSVLENFDDGLTIIVKGNCFINMVNTNFYPGISTERSMTIKGGGTLDVNSSGAAIISTFTNDLTITITDCTVHAYGGTSGLSGHKNHKLHIRNATIKASGSIKGSIHDWGDITLEDSKIKNPTNATIGTYNGMKAIVAGGTVVKNEVTIIPGTTIAGIEQLNTETGTTPTAIYSVNGHQLPKMQRGLNIVKMSDGTTKKIIR